MLSNARLHSTCRSILYVLGFLCLFSRPVHGQITNDLFVYGYFQGNYRLGTEGFLGQKTKTSSYSLQQLNLLFKKDLGSSFSAFVNMESLNSYSSEEGWGSLKFSEAWLRYHPKREFNVKVGLQIPTFNNLNEIKNRTPLLPYIIRPIVYESSYTSLLALSSFVPQQTFLQVDGTFSARRARLDYAFYLGNEEEYAAPETGLGSTLPAGSDTTTPKLLGGRVGIRVNEIKFGVSSTMDHTNLTSIGLPQIRRFRVGVDLSFVLGPFYSENEFITVNHTFSARERAILNAAARANPLVSNNLNKVFFTHLIGYRFNEQLQAYALYNYLRDRSLFALDDGLQGHAFGLAYKPVDTIAFKLQYISVSISQDELPLFIDYHADLIMGGSACSFNHGSNAFT